MNYRSKENYTFLNNYQNVDIQKRTPNSKETQQKYEQSPIKKSTQKIGLGINYRSLMDLSQHNQVKLTALPNYEPTKCSSIENGLVKAYAVNTNQGIIRNYNEDRVSIILNIVKPTHRQNENWPKCAFFGVYDGHGGSTCADFLRDHLHQYVTKQPEFPWNPMIAIKKGFEAAEKDFIQLALEQYKLGNPERSGSCAITAIIVGEYCYIANVGDSRAILSQQKGNKITELSIDHKPELETQRIQMNGGKIYQTQLTNDQGIQMIGPVRVFPGRLSVSRTFGDIEAKLEQFGGNPNVVIAQPDIKLFRITNETDFIVLGCDGIFDKLLSKEVIDNIWNDLKKNKDQLNQHEQLSSAVDSVLKESVIRKTSDNITLLIVAFQELIQPKSFGFIKQTSISDHLENLQSYLKHKQMKQNDENQKEIIQKKINYFNPSQQQFAKVLKQHQPKKASFDSNLSKIRSSLNF